MALDEIKNYLTNPPVLVPPQHGKPFRLYLSTDDTVIGSALIQEFEGKEHVIYYLSRRLVDAETRYSAIEKLCLCLYFSCTKLSHYSLSTECTVICKDDVVRYMLSMPIIVGYFKHKQKNPQTHRYRCSFHPGVFHSIDFPQRT